MTPFLRRKSVVLAIRRSVIALGGGVCAALAAVILANAARPQLRPVTAPAPARPTIIDGPPTNVEAAPPAPRLGRRPAEPFADSDDYETASDAAPREEAQAPAPPQQQADQTQTTQIQAAQMRAAPSDRCAGLADAADRMVCAYPRLSAADVALQRLYDMALYRTDDPDALREEQRRWRAVRDQVAEEDGPQALAEVYAERIRELDGPY